ncbi:MAG: hypothetical protein HYW49_04710 [Deltaproteobacteria bacterium]|nr:hypothetical protein [Deltaproteobacteria bacterium]
MRTAIRAAAAVGLFFLFSVPASRAGREFDITPAIRAFPVLSPEQARQLRKRWELLKRGDYINKQGLIVAPSFFFTREGESEIRAIYPKLKDFFGEFGEVVTIGRSPTPFLAYAWGAVAGAGSGEPAWRDIPFSYGTSAPMSAPLREKLRAHLERHGLHPGALMRRAKPVLFVDFVYSGHGALTLLGELDAWARELRIPGLAPKIGFLGLYPAELIARARYRSLQHEMLKELGSSMRPFDEKTILEAAARMSLPREGEFKKLCSKVIGHRISDRLYAYAGTHAPQANQSFTPENWGIAREVNPSGGLMGFEQTALSELYYLYLLGKRDWSCAGKLRSR